MSVDQLKKMAAEAAINYIKPGAIVGVGTGSTIGYFINALSTIKHKLDCVIASSLETTALLKTYHIPTVDLNTVNTVDIYIDGADEANAHRHLIKGRGGALLQEKIIATMAKKFVCILTDNKKVNVLGKIAPVPVEVIKMARSWVARQIVIQFGADPVYRENYKTDNGNSILDVYNLPILNPIQMEQSLNQIVGVVENGIFAARPADIILVATPKGIEIIE